MFGSAATGSLDPPLAISGHSSATGGFVGGALVDKGSDKVEVETRLDTSSVPESFLCFFVDRFLA